MNLIQNVTAGYLNTMGGAVMYTLSFEHIVIFFSYRIITLKFQYCPALITCQLLQVNCNHRVPQWSVVKLKRFTIHTYNKYLAS